MFDLDYAVEGAEPQRYSAAPALCFKLRVTSSGSSPQIHNVLLQTQIQIESTRRKYTPEEQQRLVDLFGDRERWSETVRSLLWSHATVNVPPFQGETRVDLHVPCTFDFNVAATKYFHGLESGDVPLSFLFSGSVFYQEPDGALRVARIGWEKEARYRLPVHVWQQMMDHYYPNIAWLCLQRDAFQRLQEYKSCEGIPAWEQAVEKLVAASNHACASTSESPGHYENEVAVR